MILILDARSCLLYELFQIVLEPMFNGRGDICGVKVKNMQMVGLDTAHDLIL